MPHTKTLCFGLWVTCYLDRGAYTMLSHKLHFYPFCPQTSLQRFLLCHQMKTWKDFLVGLFNLSPVLGIIYVNKNVHLVTQHPLLESMTEGSTDTSEILIPMPRPRQERSIYICLSTIKTADFMHPKREGCMVINSLIFVVVCKNILYSLNLGKNYLWTKPASNKNDRLYKKTTHCNFHWSNELWKNASCFRVD